MSQTTSSNQPHQGESARKDRAAPTEPIQFTPVDLRGRPVLPSRQDWLDAIKEAEMGNSYPLERLQAQIPNKPSNTKSGS